MSDAISLAIVGSIFAIIGIVTVTRKRFILPFGQNALRRIFNPEPMIIFVLTQARAIFFGAVCLVSGIIMITIGVQVYFSRNEQAVRDGILTVTVIIGAAITFLVFLFALFMEFLVNLQNKATNKEGTHGKRGDSTDN
jgi:hypothetical protein